MRYLAAVMLALATVGAASGAAGQTAPAAAVSVKDGQILHDADAGRVGQISRVNDDGSVQVIFDSRFVTIPGNTLSVGPDGKLKTSLTRAEIRKLR